MPEQHLFEYAVIRVVPRVEREEFLNVGVIVYCRDRRFLQAVYLLNEEQLIAAFPGVDIPLIQRYLDAFVAIAAADKNAGPIAQLDAASRFRWLTATRSTIIQSSKVHPGLCSDPLQQVQRLLKEFVLGNEE